MKKSILMLVSVFALVLFASGAVFAADVPAVEGPLIVTTCGQSPGAVMVKMSCMQAGFEADHNNHLNAEDLSGKDYKTLIITTGTSMKGMGAAGTDVKLEITRCQELIKAAREEGILVIGAHVEGMARRTDQSDKASIDGIVPLSDMILVTVESDSDGYFTDIAEEKDLPILTVKDALGIGEGLAGTR